MNILKRANEIINERSEEKERQYGPISEGMERTARIASDMLGYKVTAEATYAVMIALKLARNATAYKQDNFLDACAYLGAWDNYEQEKSQSAEADKALPEIKFKRTKDVRLPRRSTPGSAGIDFWTPHSSGVRTLKPGEAAFIPSGICASIPKDHALIAFNKSGVALHMGLSVGACVVDEDYQGEIHLHVINTSTKEVTIKPDFKLVQFVLMPYTKTEICEIGDYEKLYEQPTCRGIGGFGSTGNE